MEPRGEQVRTKAVAERRSLRFESVQDIRQELTRLEDALRAGRLRTLGNWTPGQVFNHLAMFISYAYEGYPPGLREPGAALRLVFKLMKKRFLHKPMGAGIRIPGVPGGTVGTEPCSPDEGLRNLRAWLDRLEASPPTIANPLLGSLTHDEWRNLQCRHCELHLGFLLPA